MENVILKWKAFISEALSAIVDRAQCSGQKTDWNSQHYSVTWGNRWWRCDMTSWGTMRTPPTIGRGSALPSSNGSAPRCDSQRYSSLKICFIPCLLQHLIRWVRLSRISRAFTLMFPIFEFPSRRRDPMPKHGELTADDRRRTALSITEERAKPKLDVLRRDGTLLFLVKRFYITQKDNV